jgi:hypothetical protein
MQRDCEGTAIRVVKAEAIIIRPLQVRAHRLTNDSMESPSRGWVPGPNAVESPRGMEESRKDASEVGGRVTAAFGPSPSLPQRGSIPRRRQSPGGQTCLRPRRSSSTSSASLSAANAACSAPEPPASPSSGASSSLAALITGDRGGFQPPARGSSPFSRITRPNQSPLSFIVRACVSKSTYTNPKRIPYPWAHSKLSISDQTK